MCLYVRELKKDEGRRIQQILRRCTNRAKSDGHRWFWLRNKVIKFRLLQNLFIMPNMKIAFKS